MKVCTGTGDAGPYPTELTEVAGTGVDVVPNLPKRPAPELKSHRTYVIQQNL